MRKRLTLDILDLTDVDRKTIKKMALEKYGKPSISYFVTQLLWDILKSSNKQTVDSAISNTEKNRVEIRLLSKSELKRFMEEATAHHMTVNAFIATIARSYLNKTPLFTAAEVQTLQQSNTQLIRIGRNLNQIARQLNSLEGGNITSDQIAALQNIIETHTTTVGNLLLANRKRNNE